MEKISITLAKKEDLPRINEIYEIAGNFMRANGNKTQWINGYPQIELIEEDIANGHLYVISDKNAYIHAVFMFMIGKEPSYNRIIGKWISDSEYGVVHRIASDGTMHKVLDKAIAFCEGKISHLRIDTHEDNKVMQHLIERNGFKKCGIIYVEDNTPRIAYEKI